MNFNKLIKGILLLFLVICGTCFIIIISFGGFGKRPPALDLSGLKDSVLFFAHRGMGVYYPENSVEGVVQSQMHGFNAAEVDIMRSQDEQLVIFHDENCSRLLGLNKELKTLKAAEIKKYPIIFNREKSSSYVETVDELLGSVESNIMLYFDMKLSSFKDADDIAALIHSHHCTKSVIVANWDITFIFYMESKYPEIMTALEGFNAGKEWTYYLMPKDLKPDFLSGFVYRTDEDHIAWLKRNDLMPYRIVYGVDTTNVSGALRSGFKNIIMDYDSTMNSDALVKNYLKSNAEYCLRR